MTIKYLLDTNANIEDFITKARDEYLINYKIEFPNSQTRIHTDYKDRITGKIKDTVIQQTVIETITTSIEDGEEVSHSEFTGGVDHSDRLDECFPHPDSNIDKAILMYDDEKENDMMDKASYYNPTAFARIDGKVTTEFVDRERVESEGFFVESEDA